jgi:SAM-dependent methyltransferase
LRDEIYRLTYEMEEDYWWYAARRGIVLDQVKRILASRSRQGPARILDFGCGTGANLAAMAAHGQVHGLDASPHAVSFCRKRGLERVDLLEGPPPEEPPFGGEFDLITMLDVLEHIPDQVETLKKLGSWLVPGGVLLLTVPAYESLWSGEDYVSNHLRRYTAPGLKKVMNQAGCGAARLTYFNTLLLPLQAAAIWGSRLFRPGSKYESDITPLNPLLNRTLTRIMELERKILVRRSLPLGGSILAWGWFTRSA